MTREEAIERYRIPLPVLRAYGSWGLGSAAEKTGAHQLDGSDIERLSLIMTLYDIGFADREVERYMRLSLAGSQTAAERKRLLDEKRGQMLETIHRCQQQLDRLDHLRYRLARAGKPDAP